MIIHQKYSANESVDNQRILTHSYKSAKLILAALFITASCVASCSSGYSKADYKKEAAAICEVHNPDNWKDMPANLEPHQVQELFAAKLSSALKSEKMKEIVGNIPQVSVDLRYQYVVESISELTGEPFNCPAMESYLNPSLTFENK